MRKQGKKMQIAALLLGSAVICTMPEKAAASDVYAAESDEEEKQLLDTNLHAQAAVLLDMDSGRILYEKNAETVLPMASTTKIMTCITALESGCLEDVVTVSAYAAAQPKVHLGMQKGNRYRMEDLLYSLMLESHNDSAAAIAEHIGGKEIEFSPVTERTREESQAAVGAFCAKMTQKAKELGCMNTCFLTPNGLDASAVTADGRKIVHSTTASDLARMMDYCVSESQYCREFLKITQMSSYSFMDIEEKRHYACMNHNALLTMADGALSGKTGFTNQAGYCYVGALERDGKKFALALLACGWPSHKNWKWEDCKRLFDYGLSNYEYREFVPEVKVKAVCIEGGAPENGSPWERVSVMPETEVKNRKWKLLMRTDEQLNVTVQQKNAVKAPVMPGMRVGEIIYYIEGKGGARFELGKENLYINEEINEKDFSFMMRYIWKKFFL